VQIGEFTEAIDADLVDKFLSIPDVEIKTFGDTLTVIAVGDYDNLPEAIKRKQEGIMLKKIEKAALAKKVREEKQEQKNKQAENKDSQTNDITERATEHVQQESNRHARNLTGKTVTQDVGRPTTRPVTRPVTK